MFSCSFSYYFSIFITLPFISEMVALLVSIHFIIRPTHYSLTSVTTGKNSPMNLYLFLFTYILATYMRAKVLFSSSLLNVTEP